MKPVAALRIETRRAPVKAGICLSPPGLLPGTTTADRSLSGSRAPL